MYTLQSSHQLTSPTCTIYPEFIQKLVVVDGAGLVLVEGSEDFGDVVVRNGETELLEDVSELVLGERVAAVVVQAAEHSAGEECE